MRGQENDNKHWNRQQNSETTQICSRLWTMSIYIIQFLRSISTLRILGKAPGRLSSENLSAGNLSLPAWVQYSFGLWGYFTEEVWRVYIPWPLACGREHGYKLPLLVPFWNHTQWYDIKGMIHWRGIRYFMEWFGIESNLVGRKLSIKRPRLGIVVQ